MSVILFSNSLRDRIDFAKEAEILKNQGKYEMAYIKLITDPNVDKESELYQQLHVIQSLNKQISYYSSAIALDNREEALDALIVGVEKYDNDHKKAKSLAVASEYTEVYKELIGLLKKDFKITVSEAREISYISSDEEYTERIAFVCEASK